MNGNRQRPMVRRQDFSTERKKIIRPEIWRFARTMEEAMKREDSRRLDSWKLISLEALGNRLAWNLKKFMETKDKRHLVDVANYAMMAHHKSNGVRGRF